MLKKAALDREELYQARVCLVSLSFFVTTEHKLCTTV